jgi:hypothetical protein
MRGFMTVQAQPEFDAWMAEQEKQLAEDQAR